MDPAPRTRLTSQHSGFPRQTATATVDSMAVPMKQNNQHRTTTNTERRHKTEPRSWGHRTRPDRRGPAKRERCRACAHQLGSLTLPEVKLPPSTLIAVHAYSPRQSPHHCNRIPASQTQHHVPQPATHLASRSRMKLRSKLRSSCQVRPTSSPISRTP